MLSLLQNRGGILWSHLSVCLRDSQIPQVFDEFQTNLPSPNNIIQFQSSKVKVTAGGPFLRILEITVSNFYYHLFLLHNNFYYIIGSNIEPEQNWVSDDFHLLRSNSCPHIWNILFSYCWHGGGCTLRVIVHRLYFWRNLSLPYHAQNALDWIINNK